MKTLASGAAIALRRVISSSFVGAQCARRAFSAAATYTDPAVGLTPDQTQILETAQQFARDELSPYAADWDDRKVFPEEALRKAASIGFGGLYVDPVFGGSGLSRLEGSVVVEALAAADTSTTAYL
jgi:alkylation response protein AidB-like acyl-CoA dehydrogenase